MSKTKNIVLGVTGSIAAHKAADLASRLTQQKCNVRVVMTADAQRFITSLPFKTLSRNPVMTDLYDEEEGWKPAHIELADMADLLLIAPATACTPSGSRSAAVPRRPSRGSPRRSRRTTATCSPPSASSSPRRG